jgi:hypothetical protein
MITRLPVWKYHGSAIVLQKVHHRLGKEQYPMHVFNRGELEDELVRIGFTLILRDYGIEFCTVLGVCETVVFNTYLLKVK